MDGVIMGLYGFPRIPNWGPDKGPWDERWT